MKKNILLIALISLLVGGGIGYALNNNGEKGHEGMMDHCNHDMGSDSMMMDHCMPEMGMDSMMMDMTNRMVGKSGDELDRVFLEDMIVHHQGAVDMAVILKDNTERPELKMFAQEIIDVQDKEITMMQQWLNEWFSS